MKKSTTASLLPLLVALNKFKDHGIESFVGSTDDQNFLLGLNDLARQVKLSEQQMRAFISKSAKELNAILKQNGFDIALNETVPMDLGVVAIMDICAKWLFKADATQVTHQGETFEAALIKRGVTLLHSYGKELVKIQTQEEGICVFVQKWPTERSSLELFKYALEQGRTLQPTEAQCDLTLPLVKIDEQPDISWMLGLRASNDNLAITQALQQNRLEINLDGIHAESAVALGATRGIGSSRPHVVIDVPFTVWIGYNVGDGNYFPLFVASAQPGEWQPATGSRS